MCIWRDKNFQGTLHQLADSTKMDAISFNDQTSSAYNRDKVAWVLYDDSDYSDTAKCFKAGASVADLDVYSFGDKTSAAKKRSDNTCPSGSRQFTGPNATTDVLVP